jgi:hypothetical protein
MKHYLEIIETSNKKIKINNILLERYEETKDIHPISLVFNYIDDPYKFQTASLVSKTWQKALDHHQYWEDLLDGIGIKGPKPKAKKYKTYKSIFVKNADKLCKCKSDWGITNKQIDKIRFKISILVHYCINRKKWYTTKKHFEFCSYVKEELDKIYEQSKKSNCCDKCDNEEILKDLIGDVIDKVRQKKKSIETSFKYKFSDYFHRDFINIIISSLHRILDNKDLYISRFGGFVQNYNYPKLEYVNYDTFNEAIEKHKMKDLLFS